MRRPKLGTSLVWHGRCKACYPDRIYPGVGHAMSYQRWPTSAGAGRVARGGSPERNHLAGRAAWQEIVDFFVEELEASAASQGRRLDDPPS